MHLEAVTLAVPTASQLKVSRVLEPSTAKPSLIMGYATQLQLFLVDAGSADLAAKQHNQVEFTLPKLLPPCLRCNWNYGTKTRIRRVLIV